MLCICMLFIFADPFRCHHKKKLLLWFGQEGPADPPADGTAFCSLVFGVIDDSYGLEGGGLFPQQFGGCTPSFAREGLCGFVGVCGRSMGSRRISFFPSFRHRMRLHFVWARSDLQPTDLLLRVGGVYGVLEPMAVEAVRRMQVRWRAWHAPGAPGKVFPRFGVAPQVGVKDSHSSAWPLEWSVTHKMGILDLEVGGHHGAYTGRVHVIVPFVGLKNGN